jgi:hypothetical protein
MPYTLLPLLLFKCMKKIFTSYNIIIHFFLLATTEHKEDFGWQAIFGSDNPEQAGIINVQQKHRNFYQG